MNTAIIGILKGQYFVFENWTADELNSTRNQWILNKHIERLSLNHPSISVWRYVTFNNEYELFKGDSFKLLDYDKIVKSEQPCLSRISQDWSKVSHYDLLVSAKLAKRELGL